jgi:hypothetical protein
MILNEMVFTVWRHEQASWTGTEENVEGAQSGWSVTWNGFRPRICRIQF